MKISFSLLLSCILSIHTLSGQDFESAKIETQALRDSIYVLYGMGGNIGLLAGADGNLMIDDQFEPLSNKIRQAISEISDHEIEYIINTHYHFDHTGGNKAFGPAGTTIIAHDNTRKLLKEGTQIVVAGREPNVMEAYPADALPDLTFAESMTLHMNGQTVQVFYIPNAHTSTDIIVHFKEANVFHMGDVFVRYGVPFVDNSNGGSVKGMIDACNKLLEMCDAETIIIPGHGQVSKKADLEAFRDMLQGFYNDVAEAMAAGKSLEEIHTLKLTDDLPGRSGPGFVEMIYNELSSRN